jgi:hypothetical protein
MFRSLRIKRQPEKIVADSAAISTDQLARDPTLPITFHQINTLPDNAKLRIYRALVPTGLIAEFGIDPVSWKGSQTEHHIWLAADEGTNGVLLAIRNGNGDSDEFLRLELSDNLLNGVDLNFLQISDPLGSRFSIEQDEQGRQTHFGTVYRNLVEEEKAMRAGLAPGQTRPGLRASGLVLSHLETFLATLGHRAYFLEPLTYASAWVFERRGFAYVRGHKLMDDIHEEFHPGGRLHAKLDGSSPFRQQEQWRTVRGRAWAIHDGVLEAIAARWDGLRMVKQIGKNAEVNTFPEATY